jgi:class 3 adenylate cyclase
LSFSVLFGDTNDPLAPETLRFSWSEVQRLAEAQPPPREVLLLTEQISVQGPAVERILSLCLTRGIPVSCSTAPQDEYTKVVVSLLGLPRKPGEIHELSFPSPRQEEVFLSCAHELLSWSFNRLDDSDRLLSHLLSILELFTEISLAVFSLKTAASTTLFVGASAPMDETDLDDFLKFCKQDLLLHDRFLDLKTLELRFLRGRPGKANRARTTERPIRSYICLELTDSQGGSLGLLHLGSDKNHYFNETVLSRLRPLLPLLGSVIALSLRTVALARRKSGLLALFAKFLPEPVIRKLLEESPRAEDMTSRKTRVVILFSDIRSFTALTERNEAEPVVSFLNRHFQAMVSRIAAQGGVVDKFIGDAIVAVFSADDDESGACGRAVRAARDMLRELPKVDVSSVLLEGASYGIGIGLHVGDAVAGSIGSREKLSYTIVGKVIERAEELEAETKRYGVGLLMSQSVVASLRDPELRIIDLGLDGGHPVEEHLFTLDQSG